MKRSLIPSWLFPHWNKVRRVVDPEKSEARFNEEEPLELEKGDLKAMIIAGFLIFGSVVLVIGIFIAIIIILL